MESLWKFLLEFIPNESPYHMAWAGVGLIGQALFMSRFIIQWWKSEKAKKSVLPVEFWYFSIAGGLVTLSYAIHRRDLVFTLAQMLGLIVYFRNLYLVHRERQFLRADAQWQQPPAPGVTNPHAQKDSL